MKPKRIYYYHGYHRRERDDGAPRAMLEATQRLPGFEGYHFMCYGNPALFGKRDLNVEVDWAADAFPYRQPFVVPRPNFFWASDTHVSAESMQYRLDHAKEFDLVGVAVRDHVEAFTKRGINTIWFPYGGDAVNFFPYTTIKQERDVVFVGHYANYKERLEFLDAIFRHFPDPPVDGKHRFGVWADRPLRVMAGTMCLGRIVLNHCQSDEVNMRVFEASLTEACLLTPAVSTLKELGFEDGLNVVTYSNTDEAIQKIDHYLQHPGKREEIGKAARRHVLENHTYFHRALDIYNRLGLCNYTAEEIGTIVKAILATAPKETNDGTQM